MSPTSPRLFRALESLSRSPPSFRRPSLHSYRSSTTWRVRKLSCLLDEPQNFIAAGFVTSGAFLTFECTPDAVLHASPGINVSVFDIASSTLASVHTAGSKPPSAVHSHCAGAHPQRTMAAVNEEAQHNFSTHGPEAESYRVSHDPDSSMPVCLRPPCASLQSGVWRRAEMNAPSRHTAALYSAVGGHSRVFSSHLFSVSRN